MVGKRLLIRLAAPLLGVLMLLASCTGGSVNAQEIQGLLQGMQGTEMVIKLDDGTIVKIQVDKPKSADDAQKLVGEQVSVKANVDDKGSRKLVEVRSRAAGEDQKVTGAIESITADSFTIGGKTFKVTANTILDSGLAPGVNARVEFITLSDGTLLAKEIEADENEFRFSGKVDSINDDKVVIGGQTFKLDVGSHIEDALRVGSTAKVKFKLDDDNGMRALKVEIDNSGVDVNKMRFSGKVEVKDGQTIVLSGQTFKISPDSKIDANVIKGGLAKVEFERQADGSLLVVRVLPDDGNATEDATTGGAITSIDGATVVIGGRTFKIGPATRLDTGLAPGVNAKVEFVTLSDGTLLATHVETGMDDTKSTGAIQSIDSQTLVIDGKTFKINAATILDSGLVTGALVRVEFITLADGTLLATEIETGDGTESGREVEARGRVAEGETEAGDDRGGDGPRGGDSGPSGSGSSGSGSSGSGSGN